MAMKYDYGDAVLLRAHDAHGDLVQKGCSVVAITPVETAEQAEVFGSPVGTVRYTVEFGDGSDALVPEQELDALPISQS